MLTETKLNNMLSYNPNISYEKDFYSEKENISKQSFNNEELEETNKIEDLENIIEDIEIGTAGLPDDMKDLIAGVLDPIVDFIEDNKDYLEDIEINEDNSEKEDYELSLIHI